MQIGKNLSFIILIWGCCIGCDQAAKELAQNTLRNAEPISWCQDLLRLQYVENSGGFLSFGAKFPPSVSFWLLIVLPGLFLSALSVWLMLAATLPSREMVALLLIVGGGLSNLVDRLARAGKVIDFMNIGVGTLRTGIFNLADVAIMLGIALLIFYTVHPKRG